MGLKIKTCSVCKICGLLKQCIHNIMTPAKFWKCYTNFIPSKIWENVYSIYQPQKFQKHFILIHKFISNLQLLKSYPYYYVLAFSFLILLSKWWWNPIIWYCIKLGVQYLRQKAGKLGLKINTHKTKSE